MRPSHPKCARGHTLIELILVVAVIGISVGVAVPAFMTLRRQQATLAATKEIRSILFLARSRAVARASNCGVKFLQRDGQWMYAIYDDGDGDGVRNDDIDRGIDPRFQPPRPVLHAIGFARIGLPNLPVADPSTGKPLGPDASPIRFNASTLCSFSPTGAGTPGSVFLTDGEDRVALVRVLGATGRIRVLRFNRGSGEWEEE